LAVGLLCRVQREPLPVAMDATGIKVYGVGEWKVRRLGKSKRRTQAAKLPVGVDAARGERVEAAVTTHDDGAG
jgi:hypothetical protein